MLGEVSEVQPLVVRGSKRGAMVHAQVQNCFGYKSVYNRYSSGLDSGSTLRAEPEDRRIGGVGTRG